MFFAVCILWIAACDSVKPDEHPVMLSGKQAQHPNGLRIAVPKGYMERQTGDGFDIEPEGGSDYSKNRNSVSVNVALVKSPSAEHEDSLFNTKRLAGKEIRYRIIKSAEGGSGGEAYILEVYETVPSGLIKYTQTTQAEYPAKPDFALSWSIIQTTEYKAAN